MAQTNQMIVVDDIREEAQQRSTLVEQQADHAMGRGPAAALQLFMSASERKLVRQAAIDELGMGFEYRQQAISMALDLRLQSFREACNQVLVTGKTSLRKERLEYFTRTYADVERHINTLTEEFLVDLDKRFENIGRYRNETLRQREQQRLEKRMDDFLVTFDRLMMQFAGILNEEVAFSLQPLSPENDALAMIREPGDETPSGNYSL